jgi:hypothetical protein
MSTGSGGAWGCPSSWTEAHGADPTARRGSDGVNAAPPHSCGGAVAFAGCPVARSRRARRVSTHHRALLEGVDLLQLFAETDQRVIRNPWSTTPGGPFYFTLPSDISIPSGQRRLTRSVDHSSTKHLMVHPEGPVLRNPRRPRGLRARARLLGGCAGRRYPVAATKHPDPATAGWSPPTPQPRPWSRPPRRPVDGCSFQLEPRPRRSRILRSNDRTPFPDRDKGPRHPCNGIQRFCRLALHMSPGHATIDGA